MSSDNVLESNDIHITYILPSAQNDMLKHDVSKCSSQYPEYPQFKFGFQHFIHANKKKMEITDTFQGRKKVYHVMNNYERYIDDYEEDIGAMTIPYLKNKDSKILGRSFYVLWELLFMFDLVDPNKQLTSAHLGEGPGSFTQALFYFKNKFGNTKGDKYYATTLHSNDDGKYTPPIDKTLVGLYAKHGAKLLIHSTSKKVNDKTDNGDLTKVHVGKNFATMVGNASFITADGAFEMSDKMIQEQETLPLIIGQILTAIRMQSNGGIFVLKVFETFTESTMKIVYLLTQMYNKVYVAKPFMSRQSNSEKYVICKGYSDKNKKRCISALESILDSINKDDKYIMRVFPSFELPMEFVNTMTKLNTDLANRQLISINDIVDFINGQNYYGDIYQQRRDDQIKYTKSWINRFFPDNYKKMLEYNRTKTNEIIEFNKGRAKILSAQTI